MDEEFIRNRITELRLKKGVSEYQMNMELGQDRSYIWATSSGRPMLSMEQFLNIYEYFEITPLQFFNAQESNPQLIKKTLNGMRKMSDDDSIILIGFISRLNTKNQRQEAVSVPSLVFYFIHSILWQAVLVAIHFATNCLLRAVPPNPFEHRISFYGCAFCERF